MDLKVRQDKIKKYEQFLNETLKEDLRKVSVLEKNVVDQLSGFADLKVFIKSLQDNNFKPPEKSLKTKVDVGCNFYVNAEITKTNSILMNVGYSFYVELELEEAKQFIEKKEKLLHDELKVLSNKSCKIKANIKLVMEGLSELYGINSQEVSSKSSIES